MALMPAINFRPAALQAALIAVSASLSLGAALRADDPPLPPTGEVRLESGRIAQYTIHFDRNSLRNSLRVGDSLIALTSSETLLRFELPTFRLARERIDAGAVKCLGRGESDEPLAGLADGRVCRINPLSLDLTTLDTLPSPVRWVGWGKQTAKRPAGLVAVTHATEWVERAGSRYELRFSVVHDLTSNKTITPDENSSTMLIDRAGRLWLGADRGEWGGQVTRVDLASGAATSVAPPPAREPDEHTGWDGVYGFIELRDGQIWAFGGTSHLGMNSSFITRVDGAGSRLLHETTDSGPRDEEPRLVAGPQVPITHIMEENDGLLVLAFSDAYRVDKELKSWKKIAELKVHYRWGRPDAMGSYPSIRAVHPPSRPGEPYILATVGDGYVLFDRKNTTSRRLPGQLAAPAIHSIANTDEGTYYFHVDDRQVPWRLGPKGWETAKLAPPFEPDPGDTFVDDEKQKGSWYATRVMVGPGGTIYTASEVAHSSGTRTITRRTNGKPESIVRETSYLSTSDLLLTLDGTLWKSEWKSDFGELKRLEKGRWELAGSLAKDDHPYGLECVNSDGPPWILLERFSRALWRLELSGGDNKAALSRLQLRGTKNALVINDALEWARGSLLLATDEGLKVYAPAQQTLGRADCPQPKQPATRLCRDALGRLWLANEEGLSICDVGASAVESLSSVPWVGRSAVAGLAADPEHADGVIVALSERGVAFVRALAKP
jgi:hypothetical protein